MNTEVRFGKPTPYDFETLLDQFSQTKINSFRTSSIPLAQFWKDTDQRLDELHILLNIPIDKKILCFEYPTKIEGARGKSSMTDLMILGQNYKIAVEAKFTEYKSMPADPIDKWKFKGSNSENRENVLKYWRSLILPFSKGLDDNLLKKVSYQFFHRTASACKSSEQAAVVYQLFYDVSTFKYLEKYRKKLREYVEIINPNEKLEFYVWEIEVNQKFNSSTQNPFLEMKTNKVYEILKTDFFKI